MEGQTGKMYVAWKDKPPINAINVYRTTENIDFEDGKAVFKIANGTTVRIDANQLITIGITGNCKELDKYYKGKK